MVLVDTWGWYASESSPFSDANRSRLKRARSLAVRTPSSPDQITWARPWAAACWALRLARRITHGAVRDPEISHLAVVCPVGDPGAVHGGPRYRRPLAEDRLFSSPCWWW